MFFLSQALTPSVYKSVLELNSGVLIPQRLNELTRGEFSDNCGYSKFMLEYLWTRKVCYSHLLLSLLPNGTRYTYQENYFLLYGYAVIFSSREIHLKNYDAKRTFIFHIQCCNKQHCKRSHTLPIDTFPQFTEMWMFGTMDTKYFSSSFYSHNPSNVDINKHDYVNQLQHFPRQERHLETDSDFNISFD